MALSTKQKQEWLQSIGKPKSYVYFATGPNLGPDWDWNKAVSGSYSSFEIDGFMGDAEGAYKAHKTKSKSKKTKNPGGPPAPGTSCAKTAAKNLATWVSHAMDTTTQWFTKIGNPMSQGTVPGFEISSASHIKTLKAALTDAIGELGEDADEVIALQQQLKLMQQVDTAIQATQQQQTVGLGTQGLSLQDKLEDLSDLADKMALPSTSFDEAAQLLDDVLADPKSVVDEIFLNARIATKEAQDRAVGKVFKAMQIGDEDAWLSAGIVDIVGVDDPAQANKILQAWMQAVGSIDGYSQQDAQFILDAMDKLDTVADLWQQRLVLESASDKLKNVGTVKYMGDAGSKLRGSTGDLYNAFNDLNTNRSDINWWLLGDEGTLDGSALETWVATFGDDGAEAIAGEFEQFQIQFLKFNDHGIWDEQATLSLLQDLDDKKNQVIATYQKAFEAVKDELPGSVATKAEVLDKLDSGFKTTVLDAGTDELNPMVQDKLQEYGESKSMVYYMTKEQKQDLLLLPKETFDATPYSIKYKGQVLAGDGLDVSKQKLAAKGKKVAPQTPAKASQAAQEAVSDTVTGAVDNYTVPPNSPPWYADPVTGPQSTAINKEIVGNKAFDEAWGASNGPQLVVDGKLTKGQASEIIGQIKAFPGADDWTATDVNKALNYGKKQAAASGADVLETVAKNVPEPDATDFQTVSKALDATKPAAGSVQATSSAAPPTVSWDTPHTFTYVGDGSKWGGAHRKWHFTDETGADWMLKNDSTKFRAEGELAAHRIGNLAGFDIAEARVTQQQVGPRLKRGFMQKMYSQDEVKGELADVMTYGGSFNGVEADIRRQVQEHQVLDWLIGNHDGHKQNFLVMRDGRVVGIDKGQAFKFLGTDELSATYTPNGNFGEVAYNRMWAEYRDGKIDLDLDTIHDALSRIEAIDDVVYADEIRKYAEGRFAAGYGDGFLKGTSAKNVDEFVELALERKRTIRRDFTKFYQENAKARGDTWSPMWADEYKGASKKIKTAAAPKPGEVLRPINDEFVDGLERAGTAGKSIYVQGSDFERGQILFDVVTDSSGNEVLRVQANLLADADTKMMQLIRTEGGDKLKSAARVTGAPAPGTPKLVTESSTYGSTTLKAAKTVNHHISTGDFEFNQGSLAEAKELLSKLKTQQQVWKKTIPDPDKMTDDLIDSILNAEGFRPADLAEEISATVAQHTQLKAAETFVANLEEIVEQGAKGNAAAKVAQVPTFDAAEHFAKVNDDAMKRARKRLGAVDDLAKHVEVDEPVKVFQSVNAGNNRTWQIKIGSGDRAAKLAFEEPQNIAGRGITYLAKTDDGVDLLYREHSGNYATHQGWLEMKIAPEGGKVTAADIEKARDMLGNRIGLDTGLATAEDMELTYWRMVNGTYRNSKEAVSPSSKYAKAIELADQRVRDLGSNPTKAQEIDAIRGAWRQQFGPVIDEADFLPIHDHALASHAEEIGWGYFERPELGDLSNDFGGKIVYHRTTSGDGDIRSELFQGATSDGLMAQQRRQQYGFQVSAMSASRDVETGGSAGFFTRLGHTSDAQANYVVMNPARVHRKLGTYNATRDTYGELALRPTQNSLSPKKWAAYSSRSSNETMIRDQVSWMDDVEIAFFPREADAQRVHQILRGRGITHIRGVPIEERFLYHRSPGRYTDEFFRKNVGRQGLQERMRRSAEQVVGKVREQAKKVADDLGQVASRLKTKVDDSGFGVRVMKKKLSAGRQAQLGYSKATVEGQKWATQAVRVHDSENAISISLPQLFESGGVQVAPEPFAVAEYAKGRGINTWALQHKMKFKLGYSQFEADGLVVDLSQWGVDLKGMSKYTKPQVVKEFVQALDNSTLDEFAAKWGSGAYLG